jgi:hypothetical protein
MSKPDILIDFLIEKSAQELPARRIVLLRAAAATLADEAGSKLLSDFAASLERNEHRQRRLRLYFSRKP